MLSTKSVRSQLRRHWWLPTAAVVVVSVGMSVPVNATNLHVANPSEGLICTNGTTAQITVLGQPVTSRSYVLTARDGYITTPDGNSVYMWSYSEGQKDFQYPGPFLCANEGDHVTITLHNTLKVPTSMLFTGITEVLVNGSPEVADTPTTGLLQPIAPAGSATYTFTASLPGTFLYESGTDPQLQVQMGLTGGLVVRPSTPAAQCGGTPAPNCAYAYTPPASCDNPYTAATAAHAYDNPYSTFNSCQEYVHLLSEIDPDLHHHVEAGDTSFDWAHYNARYYMINGRTFPDTVSPNFSSALPSQPYGALVHVQPRSAANPNPALIRYLNAGPVAYPFHPHSNHESTLGVDGRPMVTAAGQDASVDRFDVVVAPGQTIDTVFTWVDAQAWNSTTNPVQVPVPDMQDRFEGVFWNGSPYLGVRLPLSNGVTRYNQCGEFMHVAHSHALFQVTNFGFSGGGMLTMVRVDPPADVQAANGTVCTGPGK
jgi:FtsP/CotA-like multicopper oxidase with cupredoxin domain